MFMWSCEDTKDDEELPLWISIALPLAYFTEEPQKLKDYCNK